MYTIFGMDDVKLERYVINTRSFFRSNQFLPGRGWLEDPVQMLKKYPLINDYWEDKRANIDQIQVPAYILASYSTFLHLPGSLRGFEEMPHEKKW